MNKNPNTLCVFGRHSAMALTLSFSLLSACASGGGGPPTTMEMRTPPPAPPPPAYAPPPLPVIDASDLANTAEFQTNYGLRSINAHAAYSRGVSGAGITVAVIDDGVDTDHPDLDDNLNPLSLDIRTGAFSDLNTTETHGTQVAGIIAAERNNLGGHGVAYNADILAIRALDTDGAVSDIVAGIDYARQNGARILNLSLTVDTLPFELRQALDRAVTDGMLLVFSAGNNLANNPNRAQLDALSSYATFASANGQALAVGAIDRENNLFFLSNRPGTAGADVYLLAPGVDIVSTTVGGGQYQLTPSNSPTAFGVDLDASGSSFAAPHIAGAAAVLWEMFPNLSANEVVELLLESAIDVGASGVDPITGHGIIDLGAATAPKGTMAIALSTTSFGAKSLVSETHLISGTAFGDALAQSDAFKGGFVQDSYRRAYEFDYRKLTATVQSDVDIETLVRRRLSTRSASVQINPTTRLHVSAQHENGTWGLTESDDQAFLPESAHDRDGLSDIGLSVSNLLPDGSIVTLSNKLEGLSFVESNIGTARSDLNGGLMLNGLTDLVRGGAGLSWQTALSEDMRLNATFSTRSANRSFSDESLRHATYELGLSADLSETWHVATAIGKINENGSALGLTGSGAFGGINGASSHYLKLGARNNQGRWSSFMTIEAGATKVALSDAHLLKKFTTLWSSSFALGMHIEDTLLHNDRLALSLSQPVRVEHGAVIIDLATGINQDDRLIRNERNLALSPSNRELAGHAAYSVPVGGLLLSGEYAHRHSPSHSNQNRPEGVFLLTLSSIF